MATVLLKRDASSLDASSISSVLATGLPISILSLAATNPAAASSWLAAAALQTTTTAAWYAALPTDIQSYLRAQATAASPSSSSDSDSSRSTADAKAYAFSAASYHMSAAAVAGVVLGTLGFVVTCYALFAWQARLGPFARWAPRERPAVREGMLGMPSISWPRIDYAALGVPVGAAIRETVGDAWNIETPHFQLYKTSYHIITDTFRAEMSNLKLVHKRLFPQESAPRQQAALRRALHPAPQDLSFYYLDYSLRLRVKVQSSSTQVTDGMGMTDHGHLSKS
ncbi:hypothetical protein UCRNP2_4916 [Neofusicoccum parvum UCRNP2]|uniref:Uncharacterized protein n=1 Tax=Botryosphaeria parva (strain UCR-NP2) TaxID=1287680 RepID=R1G9X2_BOTPV|nr:hypothetical protein UCRNP2_4916 [Neofusicoccum parvum UCRNP2]